METRMSICSKEVTNITQRQLAVERIEAATETQSIVESVLQQRPRSPPPLDKNLQPKVEVETETLSTNDFSETLKCNVRASPNAPRVVTKVCVCTNPSCEANNGELCENCPMKTSSKSKDESKSKLNPPEKDLPKRYGSPIITGVSVTINNPGKIKESPKDLFTQIPEKKTTSALGSALVTTPKEPFIPASTYSGKSVPLPEETKPYLPPERQVIQEEEKQCKPQTIKVQKPDTPMVSALRIAPDRPFTPVDTPAPSKKKKPKEDPLLADLPKPKQWMSMVSALTTTPEKPFSLTVNESLAENQTILNKLEEKEVTKIKESQEKISKSSVVNKTVLPKPYEQLKPKPVGDSKSVPEVAIPPTEIQLKSQYYYDTQQNQEKRQIMSQRTEQSCLMKREYKEEHEQKSIECCRISGKTEECKEVKIEKQAEETILKKPLELTTYLQKREYLPQYQMSLNYDETIQLPHHKDIKKLLSDGQSKRESKELSQSASTQERSKEVTSSHLLSASTKQSSAITKPLITVQDDTKNVFRPVIEDKSLSTSFSPRPRSLTPSLTNNPAPILPYYQERLVPTQMPPPEINILDPKSPAVSRSPSPCPDRAPSPFRALSPRPTSPRPISPAAGPPPNPLRKGEVVPKFTKDYYQMENAKKNISEYIPHYREKIDGIEFIKCPERLPVASGSIKDTEKCTKSAKSCESKDNKYSTATVLGSQTCMGMANVKQCIDSSKASETSSITEQKVEKLKKSEMHQTCSMYKVESTGITASGNVNKHLDNVQHASRSFTQPKQLLPNTQTSISNPEQTNVYRVNHLQSNTGPTVGSSVATVPKPNTGSSGGRQPGAIGVTPKRGRGILNVGGLIGSRVPVCGHCHGQIRYLFF